MERKDVLFRKISVSLKFIFYNRCFFFLPSVSPDSRREANLHFSSANLCTSAESSEKAIMLSAISQIFCGMKEKSIPSCGVEPQAFCLAICCILYPFELPFTREGLEPSTIQYVRFHRLATVFTGGIRTLVSHFLNSC